VKHKLIAGRTKTLKLSERTQVPLPHILLFCCAYNSCTSPLLFTRFTEQDDCKPRLRKEETRSQQSHHCAEDGHNASAWLVSTCLAFAK
jgi:hypothetical protein